MQWFVLVCLVVVIIWGLNVKSILAFSFCAIVSFILARNLLESDVELDLTRLFVSKEQTEKFTNDSCLAGRSFPRSLVICRRTAIRNILRDFVLSWFENVGIDGEFILESRMLLEEATENLYDRLSCTDISSYTKNLCIILHKHLATFQASKFSLAKDHKEIQNNDLDLVQTYKSLKGEFLVHPNNELQYVRSLVDLLLYRLIKKKTMGCVTGRFILREVLAVNLFLPLIDSLSDPDFLNTSIINIFGASTFESQTVISSKFEGLTDETSKFTYKSTNGYKNQFCSGSGDKGAFSHVNTVVFKDDHVEQVEILEKESSYPKAKSPHEPLILNSLRRRLDSDDPGRFRTKCKDCQKFNKSNVSDKDIPHPVSLKADAKCEVNDPANTAKNEMVSRDKGSKEHFSNSKLKAIFNAKISAGAFMFSKNLKPFNTTPIIKPSSEFAINKLDCCLSETSPERPVYAVSSDKTMSQGDSKSSEFGHMHLLTRENQEVDHPDIPDSVSPVRKVDSTSSFEDTDIFEFADCGDDDYDSSNLAIIDESDVTKLTETQFLHNGSGNFLSEKSSSPRNKHLSSSADEWDSDAVEKFEDEDFLEGETDLQQLSTLGAESSDTTSLGEFAICEAHNPCSMISIPSTELIRDHSWEARKSKYTVYHIVYNMQLWPQSDTTGADDFGSIKCSEKSCTNSQANINRRYREFMELHHRLCDGPLSSFMEDIPKPNRKFNSPFFRLDQDVIEGRQHLLESYLKCLVNKPAILHCADFKGFLGIGDEAHTSFHKQSAVPTVPRIDKKLQKRVTKIIGHIKTAFDTGPVDGDKEEEYEDIRKVLEDKTTQDDIRTFGFCSGSCKLRHSCCFSGKCFQTFIQQQPDDDDEGEVTGLNTAQVNVLSEDLQEHQTVYPLTQTIFNLSCELFQKKESWVCLESVQQAATTVFGCFFEWWLEGLVGGLVTDEQWYYYLTLLTEIVWPGGELMKLTQGQKSEKEKEKVKQKAVQTLSDFFGGVLHAAFGTDVINSSVNDIVESLQYPDINRQLLLEVLEVTLVEVFPDILNEKELYLSSRSC